MKKNIIFLIIFCTLFVSHCEKDKLSVNIFGCDMTNWEVFDKSFEEQSVIYGLHVVGTDGNISLWVLDSPLLSSCRELKSCLRKLKVQLENDSVFQYANFQYDKPFSFKKNNSNWIGIKYKFENGIIHNYFIGSVDNRKIILLYNAFSERVFQVHYSEVMSFINNIYFN